MCNRATALDIEWNGSVSDSWQNVDNWDSVFIPPPPFPILIHRVPGDGDTATLSVPFFDDVRLHASTAPINGLTVDSLIKLHTNGFLLQVDDGNAANSGITTIDNGAQIFVDERPGGTAFQTDNLQLSGGGRLVMNGGKVIVDGTTTLVDGSSIETSTPTPDEVDLTFGGDVMLDDSSIVVGFPHTPAFSPGTTVQLQEDSLLEVKRGILLDNGVMVDVLDSKIDTFGSISTIGPMSKVHLRGNSEWEAFVINVTGGTLEIDLFSELIVSRLSAINDGQVVASSSSLSFPDRETTHTFSSGADLVAPNTNLFVHSYDRDFFGGLEFRDVGTSLDAGHVLVYSIGSSDVPYLSFFNGAVGNIRDLSIVGDNYLGQRHGVLLVSGSSAVEVSNSIKVGTPLSSSSSSTGFIQIESAGTLTQTGAGTTAVGSDTAARGTIHVATGGIYTSNQGPFLVRNRGSLIIGGGPTPGVMNIHGPLTLEGTADVDGALHLNAATTIDGGTLTLGGGILTAQSITLQNGGTLAFTSGTISVLSLNTGLTIPSGGTLAPGTNSAGDGPGSTALIGNYQQQTGSMLAIDVGGTTMASEYDFVNVSGIATLGGELELSLINGFVPDAADTFTVFNAGNLLGFFNNVVNGVRLNTSSGSGSFVVNYGIGSPFNINQIVLSDFLPNTTVDTEPDGDIDGTDFLTLQRTNPALIPVWESEYGLGALSAPTAAVPEPAISFLVTLAVLLAPLRRIGNGRQLNA